MDLDNINDIEVLREMAKHGRIKLIKDVNADEGNYVFKNGYWYIVEQDEDNVFIMSEDFVHVKTFDYFEALRYLDKYNDNIELIGDELYFISEEED